LALVKLIKAIQIVDYNDAKKLTIDDFLKVLNECHLNLNSFEMKYLFQEYEIFINGLVFYYKIINSLLNKYWDERRNNLSNDFYNHITNNGKKNITLNDIRNIYINTPNDNYKKEMFMKFLDDYKFITSTYTNKPLSLNEIRHFINYFGFGIDSDNELRELLFELDEKNIVNPENEKQYNFNHYKNNKKVQFENYKRNNKDFQNNIQNYEKKIRNNVEETLMTLRKYLERYGRNCFFNFIKHFKYYDNNTKTINKYDFVKVLKNFNINIPIMDIENIFYEYGINSNKDVINYIHFLKKITDSSITQSRDSIINDCFNKINLFANENKLKLNINLIKDLYNPKNNYFISDEIENKNDFENCLELYHYFFKGIKNDIFTEDEFFEFYHFISYLIDNDYNFSSLLNNEWNFEFNNTKNEENKEQILLNKNDFEFTFKNNNMNNEILDEEENLDNLSTKNHPRTPYIKSERNYNNNNINNILDKIKQKLKIRGIRGLIYLHKQFLISCPNLMRIEYKDFKNILIGQHIILNENEYKDLFNYYSKENYFIYSNFIREFKKELNENKLNYVENAFEILDIQKSGIIPINYIKMNYDAKNHPDVISGKKNEEEKLIEFIDCFEINNEILNYNNNDFNIKNNNIDFEIFANFYEYIAFVYDDDNIFGNIINSTFHQ